MAGIPNMCPQTGRAYLRPLIPGVGATRLRWARTPALGVIAH